MARQQIIDHSLSGKEVFAIARTKDRNLDSLDSARDKRLRLYASEQGKKETAERKAARLAEAEKAAQLAKAEKAAQLAKAKKAARLAEAEKAAQLAKAKKAAQVSKILGYTLPQVEELIRRLRLTVLRENDKRQLKIRARAYKRLTSEMTIAEFKNKKRVAQDRREKRKRQLFFLAEIAIKYNVTVDNISDVV